MVTEKTTNERVSPIRALALKFLNFFDEVGFQKKVIDAVSELLFADALKASFGPFCNIVLALQERHPIHCQTYFEKILELCSRELEEFKIEILERRYRYLLLFNFLIQISNLFCLCLELKWKMYSI